MNAWLERLKNQKRPKPYATKATKPAKDAHEGGFVGFVAYPPGHFQKNKVPTEATAQATTTEAATAKLTQAAQALGADLQELLHWYRDDLDDLAAMAEADILWIVKDYLARPRHQPCQPAAPAAPWDDRHSCHECQHLATRYNGHTCNGDCRAWPALP